MQVLPNYPRYQATEQNPDTQRILNEIRRINVEFGYIKKEPQISPRLDLESYFYPRPAYHPVLQRYNNGMALPTVRQLNTEHWSSSQDISDPFNTQTYFYPAPYLQLPYAESGRLFQRTDRAEKFMLPSKDLIVANGDNDLISAVEYAPQYALYRGQAKLIRDYNQEKALIQTVKKIVNELKENNKSHQLDTAVIINKIAEESRANHLKQHQNQLDIYVISPSNKKNKTRSDDGGVMLESTRGPSKAKLEVTTAEPTTIHSKTFFSRPKPNKSSANNVHLKTTEKPQPAIVKEEQQPLEDELENTPALFKGPFSSFFNNQKEQVVEALRQGGIIIQRLRVRQGGIAIAGPGGVATAGSGGTAIVGPGGIALTHPRSLAIAGPGAKVIAVPETVDLEKLALRSNARQLPIEGVVVATGPVIYYNPATTT